MPWSTTRALPYFIRSLIEMLLKDLLTVCFTRTHFATFSWQLNGFVAIEFWTFIFNVFALDPSHNSSFFCYLKDPKRRDWDVRKCETKKLIARSFVIWNCPIYLFVYSSRKKLLAFCVLRNKNLCIIRTFSPINSYIFFFDSDIHISFSMFTLKGCVL